MLHLFVDLDAAADHTLRAMAIDPHSTSSRIQSRSAFSKLDHSTGAYTIRDEEENFSFTVKQETAIALILQQFVKVLDEKQQSPNVEEMRETYGTKKLAVISVPSFSSSAYRLIVARVNVLSHQLSALHENGF